MRLLLLLFIVIVGIAKPGDNLVTFNVQKRIQKTGISAVVTEQQQWDPSKTAVIICDMWDHHWCKGAERRVGELAPHMNKVLTVARDKGMLIVHAPSDCMEFYESTPQRQAALKFADSTDSYDSAEKLPSEKNAVWPIDQSNEGCNDTPRCELGSPWTRQIATLEIKNNDVITDSGEEMVRLFKSKGIDHVILMGVHTNMCIVARPFGLRNMVNYGMNVVLMRDLTDAMYDSRQAPFVNHFEGLGLMVKYIETYIAPTVLSSDLTGEAPFKFAEDPRK